MLKKLCGKLTASQGMQFRNNPQMCILELNIMDEILGMDATEKIMQVRYWDQEGLPEFIILYDLYSHKVQEQFRKGEQVEVLLEEDGTYCGTIIAARNDLQDDFSPWRMYRIQWVDDTSVDTLSPWEIYRPGTSEQSFRVIPRIPDNGLLP
jgi:hypothetical protein